MSMQIRASSTQFRTQVKQARYSVNNSLKIASDKIKKTKTAQENQAIKQEEIKFSDASKAVEEIQKIYDMFDRKIQFRINKDTNRLVIKVIDANTDTVIREIPSEAIQKLQARLKEAAGILFDKKI